ncbi:hypothetical protein [Reyranella soli]|uniref:Uncharacterized protein n=1 Tax=Reyranella soli TaxID=1230389 RepID=A0A512NRT7_9HYPH|nr:hypothetical protein [Reyranella soli]GEP61661.1 hypothetical protein RSO01_88270 [Reyranella soli]
MHNFAVRQKWSIKSPTPTTAKVIIGRIESRADKRVIHVSIVEIPNPLTTVAEPFSIDHVPFDERALANSVDRLVSSDANPAPDFEGGYNRWHSDASAGVFDLDVSRVIAAFLEVVLKRRA